MDGRDSVGDFWRRNGFDADAVAVFFFVFELDLGVAFEGPALLVDARGRGGLNGSLLFLCGGRRSAGIVLRLCATDLNRGQEKNFF